jgi:hypothetical protein
MTLYEINERLDEVLSRLTVDSETGEVSDEQFDLMAEIDSLEMEKREIIEYLAKKVLNLRSDETALKAEEERLKRRRQSMEAAERSIMDVLARECGGQKTDLGVATVKFTPSQATVLTDETAAIQWCYSNHHEDCLTIALPKVNKDAVKRLLKGGTKIPGAELENRMNCSLK